MLTANNFQELDVKAGGGQMMTIGNMVRSFLTKLEWFSSLFPRIPVPIQVTTFAGLCALVSIQQFGFDALQSFFCSFTEMSAPTAVTHTHQRWFQVQLSSVFSQCFRLQVLLSHLLLSAHTVQSVRVVCKSEVAKNERDCKLHIT
jgi:hypothetical protein